MYFCSELYFLLRQNLKKIYKIDDGLTAYCLFFPNPNIHQNTEKFTGVKNRHIFHRMSAFGTQKLVLHKQRKKAFPAILSIFHFVITSKRHYMLINNELWHTPAFSTSSTKYQTRRSCPCSFTYWSYKDHTLISFKTRGATVLFWM